MLGLLLLASSAGQAQMINAPDETVDRLVYLSPRWTNRVGLADALVTSVEELRSRSLDLLGEISPGAESTGTLTLDGRRNGTSPPCAVTINGECHRVGGRLSSTKQALSQERRVVGPTYAAHENIRQHRGS